MAFIIATIILRGFIVANGTKTNTTNELINNEGETTPLEQQIKADNERDLNLIPIDLFETRLKDIFAVNYTPKVGINSKPPIPAYEFNTEETVESVEITSIEQKTNSAVGSRFNIKVRENCRCRVFGRCVDNERCLRNQNAPQNPNREINSLKKQIQ